MIRRLAAVLFVFAVTAGTALVAPTPAAAAYVEHPVYFGARWYNNQLCVEDRTKPAMRPIAKAAVWDWNVNTRLTVYYRTGVGGCNAWKQRVIIVQGDYGLTGWVGIVIKPRLRWGHTEHGNSTWLYDGPVVIKLNTSYYNTVGGWDHIITHELGHAWGLGHASICKSVMAKGACSWLTQTTTNDRQWINVIYAQ